MPDLIGIASPFLFARRWSPSMLFGASKLGLLLSAARFDTLFQDAAGTIRVNAPGQPIGLWRDTRGVIAAVQAVALNRPVLGRHPASGLRNRANGAQAVDTVAWGSGVVSNGLTYTKVGTGTEGGVPYVDVRLAGTATAAEHNLGWSESASQIALTSGDTVASVTARVIAGTPPGGSGNAGIRLLMTERNASNSLVGSVTRSTPANGLSDVTLTQVKAAATAGVAAVRMALIAETGTSETVDVTYRIKGLQFEIGSAKTALQHNLSQYDITESSQRDLWYVGTNGANQNMKIAALPWGGSDAVTLTVALAADKTGVQSGVIRGGGNASPTRFGMVKQSNDQMQVNSAGTTAVSVSHASQVSGAAEIYAMRAKIGAPSLELWRNSQLSGQTAASQGTGAYLDYDFDLAAWGGGQFCAARYYGIHAINDWLSDSNFARTRSYMADLGGVALA